MIRYVFLPLAALAGLAFGVPAVAAPGEPSGPTGMERMQHWAADHEAMLDARLAGLKAGLKLNPDQEKLWTPFETAVRDAANLRMDQMKAMMERMQKMREMMGQMQEGGMKDMSPPGQAVSPVDRVEALAQHLSDRGAAMRKVADAAKPLYASLDDSQKRLFQLLGGELLMMGHGHHGMGMMGGMGMDMMGGEGGMGMMGRESGKMNKMRNEQGDDEDSSDEE
jgi:zinc resistance-associated protein